MATREYLESILDKAKQYLPGWLWQQIHQAAVPSAGGKARWREPEEPGPLEKLALAEMRPEKLRQVGDDELRLAWLRLHQWYAAAKKRGEAVEPIVNAAVWVMEEFERRGFEYDPESELVQEAKKLQGVLKEKSLEAQLEKLPEEIVVLPEFVCAVGSAVTRRKEAEDLDITVRAKRLERDDGEYWLVETKHVWLPIRNALDPQKQGRISWDESWQGPHDDYIPLYDLVLRRKQRMERKTVKADEDRVEKAVRPGQRFVPQKPEMAGVTEYFSTDELWPWVRKKLDAGAKLVGEVKFDGFRAILSRDGDRVSIWFEDAQEDRARALPALVEAAKRSPHSSFVLDGEMLGTHRGRIVPRTQLMGLLSGEFNFEPLYCVFDCLYLDGEDLSEQPLSERRKAAEKVAASLKTDLVRVSRAVPIEDHKDLELVGKWAASQPGSEGLIVKDVTKPYRFGGSDDWAKWKTVVELKVAVLDVERTENGWTYRCGLREPGDFENVTEFRGQGYVDLGKTFVTREKVASEGDTLNVRVEELIIQREDGSLKLAWGKPTVVGPDRSRPAYTAAQAVDVARRGHALKEEVAKADVPGRGPKGAPIAFVGASPGPVEAARREPFVGPSGETLRELYLEPLGLDRDQVYLTNAVPLYLTDDRGRVREPTDEEIARWRPRLMEELDRAQPALVVALSQKAKQALGDRADFVLPHPMAVRRFGDSGEVARKLRQIKQALERVSKGGLEEGDTRAEVSAKWWAENWYRMFPPDGKGRFVYHHHWRGLSEDEVKLGEDELLRTDHSLHGDLRLEGPEELWGFTVFLGTAEDNRKAGGDRLINLPEGDNLQGAFKLAQPKAWLDVAREKPYVSEPGGVGSTSDKYAKFFEVDRGTYEVGVWREHMIEIYLHGQKLKGRFLIQYAPVAGGRRVWIVDRPKDQTPYAESRKLEDVLEELRQKGQRYLVWAKPGEKPRLIDVRTGRVEKYAEVPILKVDPAKRVVYGVVLDPYSVDSQGDWVPPADVEETAHGWMARSRVIGLQHGKKANAVPVESWLVPYPTEEDYRKAMEGKPHRIYRMKFGSDRVHSGAWILGTKILDDQLWRDIEEGRLQSYSIGGFGTRVAVSRSAMPEVQVIDIGADAA